VAAKEAKRQVRKLRREGRRKPESAATTPTAKVTDLPQDFWEFDGDRDIPF
jgi:hypothetical protein